MEPRTMQAAGTLHILQSLPKSLRVEVVAYISLCFKFRCWIDGQSCNCSALCGNFADVTPSLHVSHQSVWHCVLMALVLFIFQASQARICLQDTRVGT